MKKLYRTTLFAGVLAFGLAACGDDVELVEPTDPPPPTLTATFSPQSVSVAEGQSADLGLNISGGQQGLQADWDCVSGDGAVATVSGTPAGCRVTGVGEGSTTVTANVTKGTQTATASAAVSVAQIERATVSISQMPPSPLSGDDNPVVINMDPRDETPTLLELVFIDEDGEESVLDAQVFATGAAAAAQEDDETAEQVQQITLNANTLQGEVDEETGLFHPAVVNGEYIVKVRLFTVEGGEASPSAEQTRTREVFNVNDAIIMHRADLSQAAGARSAVEPSSGDRFWGGGDLVFQVIPRLYSGQTAGLVEVDVTAGAATLDETSLDEGPYLFTVDYDDNFDAVEDAPNSAGHTITVTNIRDVDGGNTGAAGATISGLLIDMTPPDISGREIVVENDSPLLPDGQYFSSGALRVQPPAVDGGVGVSATAGYSFLALFEEEALEDPVSSIGDEAFTEAGDLQWQVAVNWIEDRVGNRVTDDQIEAMADEGVSEPFNVDKSAPEISDVLPESTATYVFSGREGVFFTAIDPDLADGSDGSGVDAANVEVTALNVDEDDDGDFSGAPYIEDLGGGDFSFDVQAAAATLDGDALYELTLIVPDNAIVPNVGEHGLTFILDTTPPELELTQAPSNISTAAASADFTLAGLITDLNGVNAEHSMIEVMRPVTGTTCQPYDDAEHWGENAVNRNEVSIDADFSETFRVFNPAPDGQEVVRKYCIWVTGADVALDHEGEDDPNIARIRTELTVTWNPGGDPVAPAALVAVSDEEQTLTTASTELTVRVVDDIGQGVEGATVDFDDGAATGTFTPGASVQTDANGFATVEYNPGEAGNFIVTATSGTLDPVEFDLTFNATFSALEITGGNNQSTAAGTAFAAPLEVTAVDQFGEPVEGVEVTFTVASGDVTVDGGATATDTSAATGEASVTAEAGTATGAATVEASATGADSVTFNLLVT